MTAPTTADDAAAFLQSVGQILELKQERTVEGQAQYLRQKEALAGQLKAYFTRRLEQTGGAMTQEILQVADQLYIEGIASLLPEAIGVNKGTLSRLLARERTIECRRCHTRFPVVELRKIGGYTEKVDLCSDCLTEVKGSWSAITEHVAGEFQRAAALDQMVAETERPLALPEFTARLNQFAQYWETAPGVAQTCYRAIVHIGEASDGGMSVGTVLAPTGQGCMACGTRPVRLWWTRESTIAAGHPLASLLEEDDRRRLEGRHFPLLVRRPAQLIARLTPQEFFSGIPHFPLGRMPLLLLCDSCASLARGTHTEVFPGAYLGLAKESGQG